MLSPKLPLAFPAQRIVVNAEAMAWLAANPAEPGTSVITSLPDVSEMPERGFAGWRHWFLGAATNVMQWIPDDGMAIFFQSDIRHEGSWVDKSFLILTAAERAGARLVWRKVVCRKPPGSIAPGRPSFSHMLCVAKKPGQAPIRPGPDVIADAGYMAWPRAMGEAACRVACRFLHDETPTRIVVDPFCGEGAVLAVANAYGFTAIGVDLSARRCRAAIQQTPNGVAGPRTGRKSNTSC